MRDAFGGIVNVAFILTFIVIVSGYLAFNVNYTKAFRVKNKIITTFEQYEGRCGASSSCDNQIVSYMRSIGYTSPSSFECPTGSTKQNGYCYEKINAYSTTGSLDRSEKFYYKVTTVINIDIPIINKILPGLKIFQVSGNTKLMEAS